MKICYCDSDFWGGRAPDPSNSTVMTATAIEENPRVRSRPGPGFRNEEMYAISDIFLTPLRIGQILPLRRLQEGFRLS